MEITREVSTPAAGGGDAAAEAEDPQLTQRASSTVRSNVSLSVRMISRRLGSLTRRSPLPSGLDQLQSPAARALKGFKFIAQANWTDVESKFDKLTAHTNGMLPRTDFAGCIGMDNNEESKEFAGVLLEALARRTHVAAGESISKVQFKEFWELIGDQGFDSRLQTFIDMVDKDGNGIITEDEVREIISLSASANKLENIKSRADEYARLIMEQLDPQKLGYIKIENLKTILLHSASHSLSARGADTPRNLSKLLSGKLKPTKDHVVKRCCSDCLYFVVDNWQRVWVMALWLGAMAAVFAYKYIQYKNKPAAFAVMGHCLCAAKGAAETLKLNMALVLLPVCRNTITWLRNKTRLGSAVPFDDNINFHQVVAVAIVVATGIHSTSHLACDFPRLLHSSPDKFKPLEPFFKSQPKSYWQLVKGCESLTGIAMVVLMAAAFTLACPWLRRNEVKLPKPLNKLTGFNAFWYSHHLFVIVYVLLVVHGFKLYLTHDWYKKTTWMYLAIPVALYAGERLIRTFRSSVEDVRIFKVADYPGDVLALYMSKPPGFRYKSGQYIFVNCAAVSPFEWHPFSITSSPRDDYLSVHIRIVGDWTRQLEVVFKQPPPTGKDEREPDNDHKYPRVLIDGPYGAPTQDYKQYEVVLLAGLGIGATPMISVLKDIINTMRQQDEEEGVEEGRIKGSSTQFSNTHNDDFKTKKVYFYWVTREQGSFDWFNDVMNEVSETDNKGIIEMHNYCTSVYEEGDARSALIAMIQSIQHAKNGIDAVSGTKVKSHFGRPNWEHVFKRITENHPNSTIGVFYCGPEAPVRKLRHLARLFSHDHETKTKFEFHKENF